MRGTEAAKLKNKQLTKPQAPNTYMAGPSEVTLAMRRIENQLPNYRKKSVFMLSSILSNASFQNQTFPHRNLSGFANNTFTINF